MSFAEAQDAFFSHFFRHYPVHATDAGNHEHDDRWPDLTDAGTQARLDWLAEVRRRLEATGRAQRRGGDRSARPARRHRRAALRGGGARRAVVVADQLLLHPRQRALQPPQPRVRPAAGSTRERGRPDGGDRRRPRRGAGEPELRTRSRGRHVPRREGDRHDARRRGPVPNGGHDGGRARRHRASDPRRVDGGEGGRRGRRSSSIGCATTSCPARTGTSVSVASCTSASSTTR